MSKLTITVLDDDGIHQDQVDFHENPGRLPDEPSDFAEAVEELLAQYPGAKGLAVYVTEDMPEPEAA